MFSPATPMTIDRAFQFLGLGILAICILVFLYQRGKKFNKERHQRLAHRKAVDFLASQLNPIWPHH